MAADTLASQVLLASLLPTLGRAEVGTLERYSVEARLRAGRALYYQGDEAAAAWLLVAGRIRPLRWHGSSSQPLDDVTPGGWLCLPEAWLGRVCLADALAVEPCVLRRVGSFNLAALRREAWFRELACQLLAEGQYALYSQLATASATERVARAIAAACVGPAGVMPAVGLEAAAAGASAAEAGPGGAVAAAGGTRRLERSQAQLAEALGLTRETVNRCLKRLEAAGLVETERGGLLVYDLAGLRDWED